MNKSEKNIDISDLILSVTENLQLPHRVSTIALASSNPDPILSKAHHWGGIAFSSGYGGIVLLLSNLIRKELLSNGEQLIHDYVLLLKNGIESQGISSLSLFSGACGLAFAVEQASFEGQRYRSMITALQEFILDKIESVYLNPINYNIELGKPTHSILFDVIQGLSGVGRYLLEHLSIPKAEQKIKLILKTLIKLTFPITINSQIVPGWYLSNSDLLNQYTQKSSANGNFNLGLAHGVTGIMAILSIASLKGIEVDGQKEAILRIGKWIIKKAFYKDDLIHWPHTVSWEEEVGLEAPQKERSKDAWCYGVPGIARSLFLAGKACKNEEFCSFSKQAFANIFMRSPADWLLPGSNLCHGLSGLLLITKEMAKEKNCEEFKPKVAELADLIIQQINPEAPWKFRDPECSKLGKWFYIDKPSFLEGAAGIILTLISLTDQDSKWQLPLVINE